MKATRCATGSLVGLAVLALGPAAQADQALVVGVNRYPGLSGADLKGCVNDARTMGATLKQLGFEVTEVMDTQATKRGILSALGAMKGRVKPDERFVFFFAGHGTDTTEGDKAALLPHDAQGATADNDLKAQELYHAVKALPAASRSVILDSCFSGGMLVTTRGNLDLQRRKITTRYYRRAGFATRGVNQQGAKDLRIVPANDQNTNAAISGTGGVCYYSAARGNEQAAEMEFEGVRRGVFTYFLVNKLRGIQQDVWGDVNKVVSGQVVQQLRDVQHPTLSPEYTTVTLFEERGSKPAVKPTPVPPVQPAVVTPPPVKPTPPPAPPNTLWDEFNKDNPNASRVKLAIAPNQTTFKVGDRLSFSTTVGATGYLVMVERGTSGKVNLLFPESGSVEDAYVQSGKTASIPPDPNEEYRCDDPGTERVKVFLFADRELAQTFLDALGKGGLTLARCQELFTARKVKPGQFYTADFIFEVLGAGAAKPK